MDRVRRRIATASALLLALLLFGASAASAAKPPARRPASIFDDPFFRERVLAGLDRLYSMDFPAAEAKFAEVERHFPEHPAGPLLRALVPWWRLLVDPENSSLDAVFLAHIERSLELSKRRLRKDGDDTDGLFFQAGASAFRARLATYRENWMRAGLDGRRALKNMRRLAKRDPGNDDLAFGVGLFDYLVEAVPQRYRWLRPIARLFPKGDKARGLAELRRAAQHGRFAGVEARYALFQIFDQFEGDLPRASAELIQLRQLYPTNSLFHVAEGRLYARWGRWAEAGLVLQEVAARQVDGAPGYSGAVAEEALYWLARVEMGQRRYDGALEYLDRLEFLAAERTYDAYYQAVGRLRRGMAYDALGRRDDALRCYREVLAMKGGGDAHDRAKEFLAQPFAG
ncbi:MAG TPA: tetratricopeptide repeat protein [Thermoanaerobaculia bacterium]|nr:tetratricopeptide repeat protein [Thermoanaerobaculia bacterium]